MKMLKYTVKGRDMSLPHSLLHIDPMLSKHEINFVEKVDDEIFSELILCGK